MTMIPAAAQINLSKQQYCYGSFSDGTFCHMSRLEGYGCSEACLGSDLVVAPMAHEDESRTESVNEAAGSSSKDGHEELDQRDHEGWLQLGIGMTQSQYHHHSPTQNSNKLQDHHHQSTRTRRGEEEEGGLGLVELDLLPGGNTTTSSSQQLRPLTVPMFHVAEIHHRPLSSSSAATAAAAYNSSTSLFLQHPVGTISSFPQDINMSSWPFSRPFPRNMVAPSPSSSSSLGPIPGSYFTRQFQLHTHTPAGLGHVARPGIDFRVIDPPRRPHSGIWFMLQASQNQVKEPFLPQIPKSFLRTRDGRMTIRLVIKYLVNKLKLESESEVEIRCRGQQILPFLTLQHVRDSIWSPRDALVTLLPTDHIDSSSSSSSSTTTAADHIMVLQYGRSS